MTKLINFSSHLIPSSSNKDQEKDHEKTLAFIFPNLKLVTGWLNVSLNQSASRNSNNKNKKDEMEEEEEEVEMVDEKEKSEKNQEEKKKEDEDEVVEMNYEMVVCDSRIKRGEVIGIVGGEIKIKKSSTNSSSSSNHEMDEEEEDQFISILDSKSHDKYLIKPRFENDMKLE